MIQSFSQYFRLYFVNPIKNHQCFTILLKKTNNMIFQFLLQMQSQKNKEQVKENLKLLCEFKREKNLFYPFYIVGDTVSKGQFDILTIVQFLQQDSVSCLTVIPFSKRRNYSKMNSISIPLNNLPLRGISVLKILAIEVSETNYGIKIQNMDFIIGYRFGYLIFVNHSDRNGKKLVIKQRINQLNVKESFLSKASNYIFSNDQFYKVWIKGPVRSFSTHSGPYIFSYQIGKSILMSKLLSESNDCHLQALYGQIEWNDPNIFNRSNSNLVQYSNTNYKGFRQKDSLFIECKKEVSSFAITSQFEKKADQGLIFIGCETSILIVELNTLLTLQQISFQLGIRSIKIAQRDKSQRLRLLVMPYDDSLLILQFKNSELIKHCKLIGHRSFVTDSLIKQNYTISVGADHRICLCLIENIIWVYSDIKQIRMVQEQKEDIKENQNQPKKQNKIKYQRISRNWKQNGSSELHHITKINDISSHKFEDIYSLGEYSNSRSNVCDYGFGHLCKIGDYFCCFNYDGKIKIFDIKS